MSAKVQPLYRIASRLDPVQFEAIRSESQVVLVFGPGAGARSVTATLDLLAEQAPRTRCTSIVISAPEQLTDFQPLIDADRLFYLACSELSQRDLDALVHGPKQQVSLDRFLDARDLRRIALAHGVADLADALRESIAHTVRADRARCVLFDSERDLLWVPNELEGESASVGMISFVLRAGATACVPRLGDDARFDPDLDGEASDRFLGVPVFANDKVMAVLVATRSAHEPPFEPIDIAALEAIAAHASPYVAAWLVDSGTDGPFRHRAMGEQRNGLRSEPLRLESIWMRRATRLVFAAIAAFVLALALKEWLA